MPKIEVNEKLFFDLLGRTYEAPELEELLPSAKAELDGWEKGESPEASTIKIELNDTNRPDLWSTAGLARQLRIISGGEIPAYRFFSGREISQDAKGLKVLVDPSVKDVRPFIAAFVISGKPISEEMLKDVIQTQEKICWNFGRRRKTIAMGIYRSGIMKYPVHYAAVDPKRTSFVPLGFERPMNLAEILAEHPKGREFGWILEGQAKYPYLTDDSGGTLSFPPIINSAQIGAVEPGDSDLFVELTGPDIHSLALAANIVACDFADAGYSILPVEVQYPFDTPFGRNVVFPYYFQTPVSADLARIAKFLGKSFSIESTVACLTKAGCVSEPHGQYVTVFPPEYRNDFLHAADVIEEVMIGFGMGNFAPERPRDFTIGRITPIEAVSRRAKDLFVGMGFQEMIYPYLGSRRDYVERMKIREEGVIRIDNPMSESFEYVRNSPLPSLLGSESVSGKAPYPHKIFESGKVAFPARNENYGTKTRAYLGFLSAHPEANFNEAAACVSALLYYLGTEYKAAESSDPRFIEGRQAAVFRAGERIGVFGEVSPAVLAEWGITMPCAAGEIDIEAFA
jgi:phenylalanyl-tRNA synthetase beta chain